MVGEAVVESGGRMIWTRKWQFAGANALANREREANVQGHNANFQVCVFLLTRGRIDHPWRMSFVWKIIHYREHAFLCWNEIADYCNMCASGFCCSYTCRRVLENETLAYRHAK
jgi:hypothetical protein